KASASRPSEESTPGQQVQPPAATGFRASGRQVRLEREAEFERLGRGAQETGDVHRAAVRAPDVGDRRATLRLDLIAERSDSVDCGRERFRLVSRPGLRK